MAWAGPEGSVLSITEENDLFVRTDRHYTQGLKITEMFQDDYMPNFLLKFSEHTPPLGMKIEASKFGLSVGQNLYTPANIDVASYIPNDRPYAGWLYLGLILQRRGQTGADRPVLDNLELNLGLIGPEALGDEAQTTVHRLRGFHLPRGWGNQLRTEPGLQLKYARLWRHRVECGNWAGELIPHAGLSLGNVATFANLGGTVRFGYNVPNDFGPQYIDLPTVESGTESPHWGAYLFAGLDGRAMAYTAFLDGNLFESSHRIEKRVLVGDYKIGATLVLKRAEVSYTYVVRSKEFYGQSDKDGFGSVSLRYKF